MLYSALIANWEKEASPIRTLSLDARRLNRTQARARTFLSEIFGAQSVELEVLNNTLFPRTANPAFMSMADLEKWTLDGISHVIGLLEAKRDIDDFKKTGIQQGTLLADESAVEKPSKQKQSVFLVHGHDDAIRESVARFVEKLGLEPIVLFERPNGGRTIIEKFERESNVGFAIALLTADDTAVCKQDGKQETRARQNVVFELGYFAAKLGRERVAVLKQAGVAEPSDLHGIVYTELDSRGAWKFELAKELRAAGFDIDMNKVT